MVLHPAEATTRRRVATAHRDRQLLRLDVVDGHGEDGPDDDFLRRVSAAPENEIPVGLPTGRRAGPDRRRRSGPLRAAGLHDRGGLHAGDPGAPFPRSWARVGPSTSWCWGRGPGPGRFLLGIELSDGRRASGLPAPDRDDDLVFHSGSGSGGEASVEQTWWLSPLPPDGSLRLVVRCPELGIGETVTELDGSAMRRAADGVVTLWPWERPPEDRQVEPPPPDVPPDSWFAGPSDAPRQRPGGTARSRSSRRSSRPSSRVRTRRRPPAGLRRAPPTPRSASSGRPR